jgi:menaquinone-9 beta-reductase
MEPRTVQVLVVGAGPAGSATAFHLARRGVEVVLLDRRSFPRDKSCGDGLTPPAVRLLDEIGVLDRLDGSAQGVRGLRVHVRGRGSRVFEYPVETRTRGLVVPRVVLDDAIRVRAVEAGATFVPAHVTRLIHEGERCAGAILSDGNVRAIRSRVVVVAEGASGRLAREAGLVGADGPRPGFAIRGYYDGISGLEDLLEIYLPLLAEQGRYVLPSYGWVFPTGSSTANVGVGLFEQSPYLNVRQLLGEFLDGLRAADERFADAWLAGAWLGAPLRFDFTPDHCVAPGILAVGDAAGMISPFTGEGISYALESAKLAAEVIDRNLRSQPVDGSPDLEDYRLLLEKSYLGYFETGRNAARRYLLAWHVLDGTFENERPLFNLVRRAALFPEGVGQLYASRVLDDVSELVPRHGLRVREDLLAVGEILIATVRRDWPFVARLAAGGQGDPGIPFRPALLLLLAAYFGDPRDESLQTIGAAVELGFLSALSQLSVGEDSAAVQLAPHEPNWANTFAVITGDFLLAKAYHVASAADVRAAVALSEAVARACEGRLEELRHAHDTTQSEELRLRALARRAGPIFELACGLGAEHAGAPAAAVQTLRRYGHAVAIAFELADDVLAARGVSATAGRSITAEIQDGIYPVPLLKVLRRGGETASKLTVLLERVRAGEPIVADVLDMVRRDEALSSTFEDAVNWILQARLALEPLPESPAKIALSRLAQYAVERAAPAGRGGALAGRPSSRRGDDSQG